MFNKLNSYFFPFNKKKLSLTIFLFISWIPLFAQLIKPNISARVDTSKAEFNKIYHLYTNYLNSRPDSIYENPHWDKNEFKYYLVSKRVALDRSVNAMFGNNFKAFMSYYSPVILQIDSIDNNLYQVKTIYKSNKKESDEDGSSVAYITNLQASKDIKGDFKLKNTIDYRTRNWKKIDFKFIQYIVHPESNFDEKQAKEAVQFCEKLVNLFDLEIKPFKYYILPNPDELGKIYNFDYWTYYIGGQTNLPLREIFTTYGNTNYPHELVHLMFPLKKDKSYTPTIINEGLATWLGGPKFGVSFETALLDVSKTLKKYENPTLEDILNNKIRNKFDSNILYVSGAVLCKMVFDLEGKEGIWKVYNSNNESLNDILEDIFKLPRTEIDKKVINYIRNK